MSLPEPENSLQVNQAAGPQASESRIGQQAISSAITPDSMSDLLQAGIEFHRRNHFAQAVTVYQQALEIDPYNSDAWNLLGVIALQKGDPQTAIDLIGRAIAIKPDAASYHLNFGSARMEAGTCEDLDAAIKAFETAIRLDRGLAMAHNNLANALRKKGCLEGALEHFQAALLIDPECSQAYCNQGAAWIELGELEQAEASIRKALALEPESSEACANLALIEARLGKTNEAIEHYQQALQRQPNLQAGWSNLGQLLAEQGLAEGARAAFQQVFRLSSKRFHQFRMATVCPAVPQSVSEIEDYRTHLSKQLDDWSEVSLELPDGEQETSGLQPPFYLPYHGMNDLELKTKWSRLLHVQLPKERVAEMDRNRFHGPAHVGFVVADRHVPVFWKFVGGYLQQLPSNELKVSVFGNRNSIRDLKRMPISDEVSLFSYENRIDAAAATIREQNVDAIHHFEPDADCFGYMLAMRKVAPIQFTSWGIPVTSGIAAMTDYVSSDLIEPSTSDQHYSENLVRFKRLPAYFYRPDPVNKKSKEWFGFSNADRLYGCPHSLFKFHPDFDRVLAEVLRRDCDAKIVMVEGRHSIWTDLLKQRWATSIPEADQRIHFLPPQSQSDFRSLLEACDVLLDPFPFGGGATTYEAMSVGTPTVTFPGEFMRGRVTLGCWKQMGMPDCVAKDENDYVSIAIRIAMEQDFRFELKKRIIESNEQIFEDGFAVDEMRDWLVQRIHQARAG